MDNLNFKQECLKTSPVRGCFFVSLATAIAIRKKQAAEEVYKILEQTHERPLNLNSGIELISLDGTLIPETAFDAQVEAQNALNNFISRFGISLRVETANSPSSLIRSLQKGGIVIVGCNILNDYSDESHAIVIQHTVSNYFSVYDGNSGQVQTITSSDINRGILHLPSSNYNVELGYFSITV